MSFFSGFTDIVNKAGDAISNISKPISDIYNFFTNDKNYDMQLDQYNYNRDLQQQIFDREDNAVQRRMKDLKAAGVNPLLAAGGAAGTGQAVTVSAPQRGSVNPSFADYTIAKAKADADISMTKAQQELLNDQAEGVRLNNALTRKTLKWYEDHPEFSPGIESGFYSGRGLTQFADRIFRKGGFLDRVYTRMNDQADKMRSTYRSGSKKNSK